MKINQEMKRKIVQVAAFGYSNTYIADLQRKMETVLQSRQERWKVEFHF